LLAWKAANMPAAALVTAIAAPISDSVIFLILIR
jgi:hypothetical protein